MVAAEKLFAVFFLAFVTFGGLPAAANRISGGGEPGRILIADPSPALQAYVSGSGFTIESVERLDALHLSLMVVTPPRGVRATAAVRDLRMWFPSAIAARDTWFQAARDSRAGRSKVAGLQQILTAIDWQPGEADPSAGIRVGMIDSSLDAGHPALQGAAIEQQQFTSGKPSTQDTAHGTAIAAMLVGRSDDGSVAGLLHGATLFYAGIFQDGKQGPMASGADFLRAVNWLVKSGVSVINASVTSPSENPVVTYAMSLLSRDKIILVAAAGNGGPSGAPVYPAAIPSAFAVTAVSVKGDAYRYANSGNYIDIAAPGIDVPTTSRRITTGTSLAVPFVTAAVARMVQLCGVTPREAEARLLANARDLGPRGWDSHFGWGLLQMQPQCGSAAAHVSTALGK